MLWHRTKIKSDRYFSKTLELRKQFEQSLKKHAVLIMPFITLVSQFIKVNKMPSFTYKGVVCPSAISSAKDFYNAETYNASEKDVFIATQMKSGTTWMQQIVFEILHKGQGDLSDDGYRHMYALSPWIETGNNSSVPIERAPLVSPYKKHIIKTHLPAALCPYSPSAKYIYVARNPISCFLSSKDFLQFLTGPLCPNDKKLADWFCSDDMWWGSWANHVADWWDKAALVDNVFFVTFEMLKDDPEKIINQISEFLQVALTDEELALVVEKSSFAYMKKNEAHFEMSPPSIFSVSSNLRYMQSGKKNRDDALDKNIKDDIWAYSAQCLQGREFPASTYYPEIASYKNS